VGSVQSSLSSGSIAPYAESDTVELAAVQMAALSKYGNSQHQQSDSCEVREQQRILEKIRQEREAEQLQMALRLSEQESFSIDLHRDWGPRPFHEIPATMAAPASDWEQSQQMALSEYQPHHSEPRQERAEDDVQRQEMLRRGQEETERAIRSGQAHVVQCQGCRGRLQAPVHYSLVYCPTCGVVSPGQSINTRYNARNSM